MLYYLYREKMQDSIGINRNCLAMGAWKRIRGTPIFSGTLVDCNDFIDKYFNTSVRTYVNRYEQLTLEL